MAVKNTALELIDDNPYNVRKHYPQGKVREMAESLRENGLLQIPEGRESNGRVQLVYGHMRLRGFGYNQRRKEAGSWAAMPVDVKDISDQDMFHRAMEENLRRTDISPLEVARCIAAFSQMFPEVTEKDIGVKHGMTEAHVSNMKRVLRLPERILGKVDDATITFTQGRELLIFERFENAENLMRCALDGLKIGNKAYGELNTVEGLQKSTHSVISGHCRPLDKEWEGYRWDILFDTRAAGCLECDKMIRTHPTKSATAHYCTDDKCWDRHQEEHREKAAAAAKAKMQAEVINQAAQMIVQEEKAPAPMPDLPQYTLEKRGTSWIALAQGVVIAIDTDKEKANAGAVAYFSPVATKINPDYGDYVLNHTYRFVEKPGSRKLENFDVTAQDLATAAKALGVDVKNIELVKVWKSSGKTGTGGGVSAGWSKCTETLDDFSQEKLEQWCCGQCNVYFEFSPPGDNSKALVECPSCQCEYVTYRRADGVLFCLPKHNCSELPKVKIPSTLLSAADEEQLQARAGKRDQQIEETRERANLERPVGEVPCGTCLKGEACDRAFFHVADDNSGRLICEQWECDHVSWATQPAVPAEIPEELLQKARAAAGTRAEVLDLNDICTGDRYWRQVKQGYADLSAELRLVDNPEECLESCTHGFHYAFDSKAKEQKVINVCSDTKCLSKKKAAFTRKVNAAGQARKRAETKAIKEAIVQTATLDRPRIKLILLAQMAGHHTSRYYYGGGDGKHPETWLWDKLSPGTPGIDRERPDLFKRIDKLTDEELARLVVEFMLYYLTDKGDIGSYEIKAAEPLKWMGITIELEGVKP